MPRDYQFTYYFMYGAPVLDLKLDRRFTTLRPEGQAWLKGWRMAMNGPDGRPNLVPDPQGKVAGMVWLIESAELPALDKEEPGCAAQEATLFFRDKDVTVRFYAAPPTTQKPKPEFVQKLREAYTVALLPQAQIDGAL